MSLTKPIHGLPGVVSNFGSDGKSGAGNTQARAMFRSRGRGSRAHLCI